MDRYILDDDDVKLLANKFAQKLELAFWVGMAAGILTGVVVTLTWGWWARG